MNNEPLVSIITPSFNQGEFIEDTILSIRGQTYQNFEHIVVDASSTDNTYDILKKYEGTYNLSWISEPDEGMYQAINKGLKKARGEILCYLNTDDLYLPWTLEAVVGYFNQNDEVDLFYGDIINLDEVNHTIELTFCPNFNWKHALVDGGLYQPAVFWSRRAYARVGGFAEHLQFAGDYEYWIRISERGRIKKIHEFLAVDRNHYKRKTVAQSLLSDEELAQVKRGYNTNNPATSALKFLYRLNRFLWTRYDMALFIFHYLRNGSENKRFWPFFLMNAGELKLPSARRLLMRCLPYVGKCKGPWLIKNLPKGLC